jgi:hypothetical protein
LLIPNLLFKIKKEKNELQISCLYSITFQNEEKENQTAELIIANKELLQNDEKENQAAS